MNLFEAPDVIPNSSGQVLLGEHIQGEQYLFRSTLKDFERNNINLNGWTITAHGIYYLGQVSGSGDSVAINKSSVIVHDPILENINLPVTLLDQSVEGNAGRFNVLIPEDLYTGTIDPLGRVFPIVAMFWTVTDGNTPPEILKQRINLIIRFGG